MEVELLGAKGPHDGVEDSELKSSQGADHPHRAPRPCVHSLTTPVSFVIFNMREGIEPSPPAPALLTFDKSVSAGWEIIAATTPAMTPEPHATPVFNKTPQSAGCLPPMPYIDSATRPCTANLAMV